MRRTFLLLVLLGYGAAAEAQNVRILDKQNATVAEVKAEALAGTEAGLVIRCASGCSGSGGTSTTDKAGFTASTTAGTPAMGAFDDVTSSACGEDQACIARMTANRALHVNLRDASGNEVSVGGGTQYDQGTAATDTDKLTMMGCVRADTAAVATGVINLDRARCVVDATGRLWTHVGTIDGGTITSITNPVSAAQSGTWNLTNISGTVSLPTGAATAAKQPALGTAGVASADVLTVQGVASMTPLDVNSELPAAAALADNTANPTAPAVGSFNMCWDGVTWDRCPTGTSGNGAVDANTQRVTIASDSTGQIKITDGTDTALVNPSGQLEVNCSGCSGTGVSHVDDAAFTPGTDDVVPIAGVFDDTLPDSVNEGDAGAVRMSVNRNLYSTIRDAAGNERGVNVTAGNALVVDGSAVTQPVSAASLPLPTGASTLAEQQTQTTALQLLDDAVATTAAAIPAKGLAVSGTDGTNARVLKTDTSGELQIDILTFPDNEPFNVAQINGVAPSMGNGASGTGVQRVTIASDSTGTLGVNGTVAHDSVDSGAPVKVGAVAETALSGVTTVADGDVTKLYAGIDGVLIVRPHANLEDRVSGTAGITDGSSTSIVAAQGVGIRFCATTIVISNSSATNVTVDVRDGTAGTVMMTIPAAANMGGGVIPLPVPICTTANTAFAADPSAAASTVAVTAVGFKTKL